MKFVNLSVVIKTVFLLAVTTANANDVTAVKNPCPATKGTDLVYPKGQVFEVLRYNPLTDTYEIFSPAFPGEGNSFVTLQGLVGSVTKIQKQISILKKNRENIVGGEFKAEKDIPTLLLSEVSARKTCSKEHKISAE